jgi:hypothetical protein
MNFHKLHNKLIVCFKREELERLYKEDQLLAMKKEMAKQGVTVEDLESDYAKREIKNFKKVADAVGLYVANDRDLHEVFASMHIFLPFYEKNSEVCFELKSSFILGRTAISTLVDLNHLREDVLGDFIIKSSDGFRIIQLKRYREGLDADSVFEYVKQQLAKYGRSLGDTNLLIILQPPKGSSLDGLDFEEVYQRLKALNLVITGQVLLAFNSNSTETVIEQVYPEHTTTSVKIAWASGKSPSA